MANDISAMSNFLKEHVHPMLMDAISIRSKERQLFGDIKKVPIDGKYYRIDTLTQGNFRMEGRAERGQLPGTGYAPTGTPSTSEDVPAPVSAIELQFNRKFVYSVLDFSGPSTEATLTVGGEALNKLVIKQTLEAFPESVSRCWAGGQGSVLGQMTAYSTPTATLLPADNPATQTLAVPWAGNRYIREGMVVDVVDGGTNIRGALLAGTNDRGRAITAVSEDLGSTSCTVAHVSGTAATNWGDTDMFVPFASRAAGAISEAAGMEANWYNPYGILDAVQNYTSDPHYKIKFYGNLDRSLAVNRILQSKIITNSTPTALTLDMLNILVERIRVDALAGDEPETFYLYDSVYRKFAQSAGFMTMANFATNQPVRYQNPGKGFTPVVGVSGIEVNNIGASGSVRFFVSQFAPHYRCYAITKKYMLCLEESPLKVLDKDGMTLRMINNNTDAYRIFYGWYHSGPVNMKPISCGYVTGLLGDQNNQT